jgi:hypothetical protein
VREARNEADWGERAAAGSAELSRFEQVATVNAVLTVGFSLESKPHPLKRG